MEKINKILENLKNGDLFALEHRDYSISFKNSELKSISENISKGFQLRAKYNGKMAVATTSAEAKLESISEAVHKNARNGAECSFEFSKADKNITDNDYISEFEKIKPEFFIEKGKKALELWKQKNSDATLNIGFGKDYYKFELYNTNGFKGSYDNFFKSFSLLATLAREGDIFRIGEGADNIDDETIKEEMDKLYKKLEIAKNIKKLKTGHYPVIFSSDCIPLILKAFESGISGERIYKKISPLVDKLESKIFSDKINIIETPFADFYGGRIPFDDEGVLTKKKFFIEKGILKNYLLTLFTASKLGVEPCGNGFRRSHIYEAPSYETGPSAHFSKMLIEKGNIVYEDFIKDTQEGVFIENSADCWMGNLVNGDVSGTISKGFKIENGKIAGRIKDQSFSLNIYDMLNKNLIGLGNKLLKSRNFLCPYAYVKDVVIS